jgi:o-succinylbenzoate synthase
VTPAPPVSLDDVLDRLHVVTLPMRVRFRGITSRELALIDGPAGWGEFGAFLEYGDAEAAHWLAAALDSAYRPAPPRRCPTSWPASPARVPRR